MLSLSPKPISVPHQNPCYVSLWTENLHLEAQGWVLGWVLSPPKVISNSTAAATEPAVGQPGTLRFSKMESSIHYS